MRYVQDFADQLEAPPCCAWLYLVFNEGYSGDVDLAGEAIRLTRQDQP